VANARLGRRSLPKSDGGLLFGRPLQHLLGQYPLPARLSESHLRHFRTSKHARSLLGKGTILFREGELPRGVCVILSGRVKESITSAQGRTVVIGFYGPGSVLGLEANVLGRVYAVTAETVQATEALSVRRHDLMAEIRANHTAALQVAQLLAENSSFLAGKLRSIELSESAPQAVARYLLGCGTEDGGCDGRVMHLNTSQETVAQMLGLSRETVSRQLAHFRKEGLLRWDRAYFVILDRKALEKLADLPPAAA
jgi:CRP-like cAMP-binding protein